MPAYLDTSALIRAWRLKLVPEGITRAHSVAEFYANLTKGLTVPVKGVLTRLPFPPSVAAQAAKETFANVRFADLTGAEALAELLFASAKNIQSANIHDWMHAAVAGREGCQEIATSNLKHFRECTPLKLVEPADYLAR